MLRLLLLTLSATLAALGLLAQEAPSYPAAPGFRADESDPEAIAIADEVMVAMGGYEAWEQARYLEWTFFGNRTLLWDKWTGQVRIDFLQTEDVFIVNVHENTGMVWLAGEAQSHPDTLERYLQRARSIWINDSYWLVMPFKLKDSGVKLAYLGPEKTDNGFFADKLELTFEAVGDTPQNKYWVFVDQDTDLVVQWSFFNDAADDRPRFTTPWTDYQSHRGLLLSGGRGQRELSGIAVYREVPAAVFTNFTRPGF